MQPKTPAQEIFFFPHAAKAILRRDANETGHAENPGAEFPGRTRRLPEGPSVAWGMQEMLEKGSKTSRHSRTIRATSLDTTRCIRCFPAVRCTETLQRQRCG